MKASLPRGINPRETAFDVIYDVLEQGKYLKESIESISFNGLSKRDRAFVNSLTHGTVEKKIVLDFLINKYSKISTSKMKPVVLNILRMSLYEIFYFDRTPDSASINEAVNLTKKKGYKGLSGFVNGVLRNINRNKEALIAEIKTSKDPEIIFQVPMDIITGFENDYGKEKAYEILDGFKEKSLNTARVMTSKILAEDLIKKLESENISSEILDKYSIIIKNPEEAIHSECFKNGYFYIQDLSSMEVEKAFSEITNYFSNKNDIKLLDLCSAPGGKSIDFSDTYSDRIEILSCDISDKKIAKIEENIKRLSLKNIKTCKNNALFYNDSLKNKFDIVLLDVPCSGLGTMSHRPEIKYRQSESSYKDLQKIQRKIIENALIYTRPEGFIIYSTCTLRKAENEDIVDSFIENHKGIERLFTKTIYPDKMHDGFFVSILKKTYE